MRVHLLLCPFAVLISVTKQLDVHDTGLVGDGRGRTGDFPTTYSFDMAEAVPPLAPDFADYDKLQAELAALDLSQAPYVLEWPTPQRHKFGDHQVLRPIRHLLVPQPSELQAQEVATGCGLSSTCTRPAA